MLASFLIHASFWLDIIQWKRFEVNRGATPQFGELWLDHIVAISYDWFCVVQIHFTLVLPEDIWTNAFSFHLLIFRRKRSRGCNRNERDVLDLVFHAAFLENTKPPQQFLSSRRSLLMEGTKRKRSRSLFTQPNEAIDPRPTSKRPMRCSRKERKATVWGWSGGSGGGRKPPV